MADLSALLEREAGAEIEAILSEARERASEIVAQAESEAETLRASRERAAESQRQAALVRARSSAQLEAASMRLRAQQEAIVGVFDEVGERLDALARDRKRYAEVLTTLAREALAGLEGARPDAVVVHPDDEATAREALSALKLDAPLETDPSVRTGVRLRTGRVSVENSLHGRLAALREELASEVAHALTGKEA